MIHAGMHRNYVATRRPAAKERATMSEVENPFLKDGRINPDPGNLPPDKGHIVPSDRGERPASQGGSRPRPETPASQGGAYPTRQPPGRSERHRAEHRRRS